MKCFLWASQKGFPLSNSALAQTQLFFWYWNSYQIWRRSYKVRFLKRTVLTQPAGIYLLKFNNSNIRTRSKKCSKLTMKTQERHQWRRSSVFIVKFEHISQLALVFLSFNFEHAIAGRPTLLLNPSVRKL